MMSFLTFTILLSEFTYTPFEGRWIDYARSGPMKDGRYIVMEREGKKGDYDGGAFHLVLDENGEILYEIDTADRAWFLQNGMFGDPDTWIYGNHAGETFWIFHPEHGARELKQEGLNFGKEGFREILIKDEGTILVIVSEYSRRQNGKRKSITEIEELYFHETTVDSFFTQAPVPNRYVSYQEDRSLRYRLHSDGVLFFSEMLPWEYYSYEFGKLLSRERGPQPLKPIKLPFQIRFIKKKGNYLLVSASILRFGHAMVLMKNGEVLLTLPGLGPDNQEPELNRNLRYLFTHFESGRVHLKDDVLEMVVLGELRQLDLETMTLRKRRLPIPTDTAVAPNSNREIKVTAEKLEVRQIDRTWRNAALEVEPEVIEIPESLHGLPKPKQK